MRTLIFIVLGVVIGTLFFSTMSENKILTKPSPSPSPIGKVEKANLVSKASFLIFTDGTKRDFGFERYYNQSEEVYITEAAPHIVISKKASITWGDFFKTLPMELTSECLTTGTGQTFCNTDSKKLVFYVNGNITTNLLQLPIKNNDRVLIHYGVQDKNAINSEINQIPLP